MAEIHRKVIKQNGRNVVSRIFQAGNDKDTIAAWNADLNRILQVFNVCSVAFTWSSLIVHFQTELIMNTHVTVSDIRDDVSGIRRGMSMIQEEIGGQVCLVSASHTQSQQWEDAYCCLGPNQVGRSQVSSFNYQ